MPAVQTLDISPVGRVEGDLDIRVDIKDGHVVNAWTRMPELQRQVAMEGAYTAPFTVTRALLRYGSSYEIAVKSFWPYERIQDPYPESHDVLRTLIQKSLGQRRPAYIFVNNRLEGNAPGTTRGLVDSLE